MERAGALINRLQEQYQQNAGADKLLVTLHILAAELELEKSKMVQKAKTVSVLAPNFLRSQRQEVETVDTPVAAPVAPKPVAPVVEVKPQVAETRIVETPVAPKGVPAFNYTPAVEAPPAAVPRQVHELNEIMARKEESLNERLKTNNVELGATLQHAPVRDLKRGIGINDRYVFLNELFKGDEAMFERSIKTINAFTIYAEAEYWIKRELKTKLGWNDDAPAVIQFDQLVKRRFA